ncbi:ribonuclease P protein subunit RPP30 [Halodesulfurarchaeum formicicum]|uniref:Ribonuclease P protein component 3 n=1 Tax=Halodesulfurarchaeum formicicum TaxID=1873524 RepID=A0A1D8S377_9EURY|nr:RNase P subunit p30 family protein [Halodesulfurarchaeum formicicum]AOW79791.1 ribonuclease P protein subunit RPP30 [Halodesulfurarchaeum formicicum]
MYESVRVREDGPTTPDRFGLTVKNAGFEGLVVRNRQSTPAAVDHEAIAETHGIDVVQGIEITADEPGRASGAIGNRRPEAEVLLVQGRDPEMNRFVVEQAQVDVLADPMGGAGDVNHVIAQTAAANDVALELNLGPVLRSSGGDRVRAIKALRKLHELVADAGAPFVVSGAPSSHLQVRGPRELFAVGAQIGFDHETIQQGLAAWRTIAERNRHRRDPDTVGPGVTVSEPEN